MIAHSPIVLLGDITADQLANLREWLGKIPRDQSAESPATDPLPRLHPALPAAAVTPGLLDVVALRASHFAHGHTVEADLRRQPGVLARAGRTHAVDAIDELARGPARRASARKHLARAAALLLAELDRLDAQDANEPTRNGEPA